jgi:hypothetical protein
MRPVRIRQQFVMTLSLLAALASAPSLALGVAPAWAGTTSGKAVTVSGLDDLSATVDTYAKGNVGKVLGIGLGLGGMAIIAAGRLGIGALAAAAGVGAAFVPSLIGTAFDATAAAPLLPSPGPGLLRSAWWAPSLGLLYPVLLALRLLIDPVFLTVLAVGRWGQRWLAHRPRRATSC